MLPVVIIFILIALVSTLVIINIFEPEAVNSIKESIEDKVIDNTLDNRANNKVIEAYKNEIMSDNSLSDEEKDKLVSEVTIDNIYSHFGSLSNKEIQSAIRDGLIEATDIAYIAYNYKDLYTDTSKETTIKDIQSDIEKLRNS